MMLGSGGSPEGPVQRSVPADERTGGEEQEPQHGQAKVHPVRRVHAEPGQAAKHVHEERAGVNWERRRSESFGVKQHSHLFLLPFHVCVCGLSEPLTHPKVVHDLHSLLELYGNVHGNVVVKTRANRELLRQRRPVVLTSCVKKRGTGWRSRKHTPPGSDKQSAIKPTREWLTDLRLRGTVTLAPDDPALLLFSPAPPASSTTQPEHALGPERHTHTQRFYTPQWKDIRIVSKSSKDGNSFVFFFT